MFDFLWETFLVLVNISKRKRKKACILGFPWLENTFLRVLGANAATLADLTSDFLSDHLTGMARKEQTQKERRKRSTADGKYQ